jgi:hypothetical protein
MTTPLSVIANIQLVHNINSYCPRADAITRVIAFETCREASFPRNNFLPRSGNGLPRVPIMPYEVLRVSCFT